MPDHRLIINAHMQGLIAKVGGYDAAIAYLEATNGRPYSKGTLSQKKNLTLDWTIMDMIALQELAGRSPVTEWLVSLAEESDAAGCVTTAAAELASESGEAIAAVLNARTPEQRAKAVEELHDVIGSSERLVDALEAGA